jgi:hypothetical protein
MTRILFLGAPIEAVAEPGLDYKTKFERTGHNTGNLLIGYALRRQLVCSSYKYGNPGNSSNINQDFDLIAIPAANFIYKGFDFGWLADIIEKTTLPCLIVGLGAQLPSISSSEIDIPEGSKRFLKVISERVTSIGVRGAFTADVLARLGVKNTTVTGCPSLYWSLGPEIRITKKSWSPDFRVSLNGSRNVTQHSFSADDAMRVEGALLKLAITQGYDYVLQNEFPEFDLLYTDPPLTDALRLSLQSISNRFALGVTPEEYATFAKKLCKAFFSVEGWADYIQMKDFSFGTRFHGNMIALLNGVPAVIIAHDSRTTEMCQFMKIPYHAVNQCDPTQLQRLYEEADFETFSSHYRTLYANYLEFLKQNQVRHSLKELSSNVVEVSG